MPISIFQHFLKRFKRVINTAIWSVIGLYLLIVILLHVAAIQRFIGAKVADAVAQKLGTEVQIGKVDLGLFNRIIIDNFSVKDQKHKKLLNATRLSVRINYAALLQGRIAISSVQLFGADANLYKERPELPANYQFVLDSLASKDTLTHTPLNLQINSIIIRHGNITYNILSKPRDKNRFSIDHLSFRNVSGHIMLNALQDDSLNLNVKKLSFEEQSGIKLQELGFKLVANSQKATLQKLSFQLPNSKLSADNIIAFYKQKDRKLILPSLRFRGEFEQIDLFLPDFKSILPAFSQLNHTFSSSFSFEGTGTSLTVKSFKLNASNRGLQLHANAFLKGGFNKPKWFVNISRFSIRQEMLHSLLSPFVSDDKLPAVVKQMGSIAYTGDVGGHGTDLSAKGLLTTDAGKIRLNVGRHHSTLNGYIQTDGVDLKLLTADNRFGSVAMKMDFRGTFHAQKLTALSARGIVSQMDYNAYTYRNVTINAAYQNKKITGRLGIDDPNGRIELSGSVNTARNRIEGAVEASVKHFNPTALKLTGQYPKTTFDFNLSTHFIGKDLLNANGSLELKDFQMLSEKSNYMLEQLLITSQTQNNQRVLALQSDFGNARIAGRFNYKTLLQSFINLVGDKLPTIPGLPRTTQKNNNDFLISATVHKSDWLQHLAHVPLVLSQPVSLSGNLNDRHKALNLTLTANRFEYDGKTYRNGLVRITTPNDTLHAETKLTALNQEGTGFDVGITADAANNQLNTRLYFNNNEKKLLKGEINAQTQFFRNEKGLSAANIRIQESVLHIGDSIWTVSPSTITYSQNNLSVEHFKIAHQNQYLTIDGTATKSLNETLQVNFNDIDVSYVLNFVNFHAVEFSGRASGNAFVASVLSHPQAFASVSVHNFEFEHGKMGTLNAEVQWDRKEEQINIDAIAYEQEDKHTLIKGYVSPKKNYIDLDITAHNTNIAFVQNFTSSFMHNVQGHANGAVKLSGHLDNINLTGKLVADGSMAITSLNTVYKLQNDTITFIPDEIRFENDTIYDRNGNIGIVTGSLYHQSLTNLSYKIGIKARNLLAYDTHSFGENTFYGTAFVTGDCHIQGKSGEVIIDVNATTEKGSRLVYNVASNAAISDQGFIHWGIRRSMADSTDVATLPATAVEEEKDEPSKPDIPTDIRLNFLINCTQDAALQLLMDERSGDNIVLRGDGVLRATYYNKGSFDLFGTYLVDNGIYKLTVQNVIKRDFLFQQGGTITFGGDPFAASLNLKALYTLNGVSLSDLNIGRSFSSNNIKVNCLMNITGSPGSPKVEFGLDLPTLNSDVKQMVFNLITGEDEMNQQVLYLLAVGRFYTKSTNNLSSGDAEQQSQTSLAMQSILSGTLSQQINSVLSSVINNANWNFGANISTGNEGWNNAEYEGLLSGRLLNNRLLINGQFGYRDNANATTNFIGDFNIRYLLSPGGSFSVNVYNQTNDRYFTRNSLNTQGIGLLIKKDFNSWLELFGKKRKKKQTDTLETKKNKALNR